MEIITNVSPYEIIYHREIIWTIFILFHLLFDIILLHWGITSITELNGNWEHVEISICRNKCHGSLRRSVDFGSFRSHLFLSRRVSYSRKADDAGKWAQTSFTLFKKVYLFANIPWNTEFHTARISALVHYLNLKVR